MPEGHERVRENWRDIACRKLSGTISFLPLYSAHIYYRQFVRKRKVKCSNTHIGNLKRVLEPKEEKESAAMRPKVTSQLSNLQLPF